MTHHDESQPMHTPEQQRELADMAQDSTVYTVEGEPGLYASPDPDTTLTNQHSGEGGDYRGG
jgi:hypothetical protein